MQIYEHNIKLSWLKSAAIASVWGSTEVMLGSFLHNIKLPMAGTLLTFIAIIYMSVFAIIWKEKLLILKASLITALIKSISPSSVLLGPMTAIILEGLLFELALLVIGRNFLGIVLAGMLVQISVLVHKAIALLIVYSTDLVRIINNLYTFAQRQFQFELSGQQALFIIIIIYAIIGLSASIIGYIAAKSTKKKLQNLSKDLNINYFVIPVKINSRPFITTPAKKNPFILLVFDFIFMIFLLWLITQINFPLALTITFLSFAIYYYLYPQAFGIFRKTFFWIQIFIFFIFGVLFYYDTPSKLMFNPHGFINSGLMILRALIIIVFFSVVSIQLNNERIKAFVLRKGFHNVYLTLQLTFLTLPKFIEYFSNKLNFRLIQKLIIFSINLLDFYKRNITQRKLILIQGDLNSGKTRFVKKIISILTKNFFSIGGIYTEKTLENNKWNYYVVDILTKQKILLCTENKIENPYFKTMRFYFSKTGINYGISFIEKSITKKIIIIDEIGKLELLNYGWSPILETLLDLNKILIWTVRKKYTKEILNKFMINKAYIFDVSIDKPEQVVKFILQTYNYEK